MDRIAIRRALVSVYDKTGLADLGRALADAGVEVWPGHDPEWEPWAATIRGERVVVR